MIGLRRLRVGVGAAGLALAGLGWMSAGMADSFYLKSGEVIEGEILEATRNTIVLRSGGAVRPTSRGVIERIVITLADGSELSGELVGWADGVLEIRSADVVMQVRDGEIIDGGNEVASPKTDIPAPNVATANVVTPENQAAPAAQPSKIVAMQGLPEFTFKDGKALVGQIIHATGSIVTIRQHGGGVVPASRAHFDGIRYVDENGVVQSGRLVDWSNGVYQLKNGERDVLASLDDQAAQAGPPPALLQAQTVAPEPLEKLAVASIESADAAISPEAESNTGEAAGEQAVRSIEEPADDVAELSEAETTGAGGPVSETAVAETAVAELTNPNVTPAAPAVESDKPAANGGPYVIEPRVSDVGEDNGAVVFEFRLKEPADRPLVILYAATDDTAKAGQDFEAKSGVVTFNAGSNYAEVRVPLIDDEESEASEQFHLFLSGDPETITFSQRQVPATINDND